MVNNRTIIIIINKLTPEPLNLFSKYEDPVYEKNISYKNEKASRPET